MKFIYSDGGRSKYFKGTTGDCVVRAICNASGKDYKEVYDAINELAKNERRGKRKKGVSNARTGVYRTTEKKYIEEVLGWRWVATMRIGEGCKVHLNEDELPSGTLIVAVSKHLTCVKDGVLYDTYDCSRGESRCVYGYWIKPTADEEEAFRKQQEHANKLIEAQKKAIEETKAKVEAVKKAYKPKLTKLEKKLKEIKHQLTLETNRMNREIKKIKEQDGKAFCDKVLLGEVD